VNIIHFAVPKSVAPTDTLHWLTSPFTPPPVSLIIYKIKLIIRVNTAPNLLSRLESVPCNSREDDWSVGRTWTLGCGSQLAA
jgi:hypothetical protein